VDDPQIAANNDIPWTKMDQDWFIALPRVPPAAISLDRQG
jgi:hypothetical protein